MAVGLAPEGRGTRWRTPASPKDRSSCRMRTAAPTAIAVTTSAATLAPGPSRSRASASVTSSASASISSQNAPPSDTRAYLSPAGISDVAPWPTASASAIRPSTPAASRTSGARDSSTTAPTAASRTDSTTPVTGGRATEQAVRIPRGDPVGLEHQERHGADGRRTHHAGQSTQPVDPARAALSTCHDRDGAQRWPSGSLVGHEALLLQIVRGDVMRRLAAELDPGVEFLQSPAGQALRTPASAPRRSSGSPSSTASRMIGAGA